MHDLFGSTSSWLGEADSVYVLGSDKMTYHRSYMCNDISKYLFATSCLGYSHECSSLGLPKSRPGIEVSIPEVADYIIRVVDELVCSYDQSVVSELFYLHIVLVSLMGSGVIV